MLKERGFNPTLLDLNWEFGTSIAGRISAVEARNASEDGMLAKMNLPYFRAEDKLRAIAQPYLGDWNAQIGFEFDRFRHGSSAETMCALDASSPFDQWFRLSVVPRISDLSPGVIGISVAVSQQLYPTLRLCKILREEGYDGFVALGGNTISRLWTELEIPRLFQLCDGLLRFQGEEALVSLCEELQGQKRLELVPGLKWLRDGQIFENQENVEVDLKALPTPDFSGLPVGQYWGENYLNIVAARGCYYGGCDFCSIPYGWGKGGYAGVRSPGRVLADVSELIQRYGIRRFKFVDEALSPTFLRKFASGLIENKVRIEWEGYVRLESIWNDEGFIEQLGRSGFKKGYFGLELVPSTGRDLLMKGDQPKLEKLLVDCRSAGIKVHFFCMVGFPGTGLQEAEDTVRFLVENSSSIDTADVVPWTYSKHTVVSSVEPIIDPELDWSLEYEHRALEEGVLGSKEVARLAFLCEEIIWDEAPSLLHPTYRLVSPWEPWSGPQAGCKLTEINACSGLKSLGL